MMPLAVWMPMITPVSPPNYNDNYEYEEELVRSRKRAKGFYGSERYWPQLS